MRPAWDARPFALCVISGVSSLLLISSARSAESPSTQPAQVPYSAATQPAPSIPTTQPDFADRIEQPIPGVRWGADYRLRWEYLDNGFTLDRRTPDDEWSWQRSRPRVWTTYTPVDRVDLNARLVWESRHWCSPDARDEWDWQDGLFDMMNVKVRIPDAPVTLTVGRQEIILGDGWLVLDGTPLDGSRTIHFDAARLTMDLKEAKTSADAIFIHNGSDADRWLPPVDDHDTATAEQDEIGAILYVSNKTLVNTQLDGYFIYKGDEDVLPKGDDGDVFTTGARGLRDWTRHFSSKTEGAVQTGRRNSRDLCSFAFNSRATCHLRDPLADRFRLTYEFLSGDDPGSRSRDEAFDPLWGRWPQWSEMYIYTMAGETRIAEMTNHHRLGFGWQADPTDRLTLSTDYYLLFADENTYRGRAGFSNQGSFRGQLLAGILRYRFNRFLSAHVIGEYFQPGGYFEDPRNGPVAYFRSEMMFTF